MGYIVCKDPHIRIDFMVREEHQAELVGYIRRMNCEYKKEVRSDLGNGDVWVCLKDIRPAKREGGGRVYGKQLGELIGLFYSIEWTNLTEGKEDKYYLMLTDRRREKYAGKNRKKADQRSEGGDAGESNAAV